LPVPIWRAPIYEALTSAELIFVKPIWRVPTFATPTWPGPS
jgi:hypothetical protein